MLDKKTIFSLPIASVTLQELPSVVETFIKKNGKKTFFYINAHCINLAQKDLEYKTILQKADLVYSGGIGPIWASTFLGKPLLQRTPTPDFIQKIFALCQKYKWTIYLLGADLPTIKKTVSIISKIYPDIVVGYHCGYFSQKEERNIIKDINKLKPTILFVGMGSPKQEKWIHAHRDALNVSVLWAVGALFDVISEKISRAPKWMQKIGMEWFYRLLQEPQRLWKRYLFGNTTFLVNIVKESFSKKQTPIS